MSIAVHTPPPAPPTRSRARQPAGVLDTSVETVDAALWVFRGSASPMSRPHRHDDLELNFVLTGRLDYMFGGTRMSVEAGQVALFWGTTAHRLLVPEGGNDSESCWVHIPLTTVLGWHLPDADLGALLSARPVILPARAAARDVEEMFASWSDDVGRDATETVTLLEAHAIVLRLMRSHREAADPAEGPSQPGAAAYGTARANDSATDSMATVMAMAQYIASHFRDPIGPSAITDAVHLNPNYAMSLFRNTIGSTVGDYLTQCRVAEAQRLLITTSMGASEIAHASGFGSQSSFYAHFSKACGASPAEYRTLHR